MEVNMKKYMKLSFYLLLAAFLIVGCSDNGETDDEQNNNNQNQETNEAADEDDASEEIYEEENPDDTSENEEETNESNDTFVENQEGLRVGDAGTIVDNNKNRYEVTLNSVEFKDSVAGLELNGEAFVVANITVKNIGDDSFDVLNMHSSGFGPEGALQASMNEVFRDAGVELEEDLIEGEIAPGESVTGDHVFEIDQLADQYLFIIGGSGQQIITYANWDVLESDIE